MPSTLSYFTPSKATPTSGGNVDSRLLPFFRAITGGRQLVSTIYHQRFRLLGKGGQGVVFAADRRGSDQFNLRVAVKVFSPEPYRDDESYCADMVRIGDIVRRVALIQHDNLVGIQNFVEYKGIRIMEMECIDGFNLREVLSPRMLATTRAHAAPSTWSYIHRVIVTEGPVQARLKPGVAIQVLRDCLAGLAALHRQGIVHGDIKPSNIMLKRTGNVKLIDLGSATSMGGSAPCRMWSPAYAAPEIMLGEENTPLADLASLGYVLVEMLAGRCPFEGLSTRDELLAAKSTLARRLPDCLPEEVCSNGLLLHLCCRLVAFEPSRRFPTAQAAYQERGGVADFHRQLVKGDLSSEYETDFRVWLEQVDSIYD